jgi:FAD/FMN-containing dehydrogenase
VPGQFGAGALDAGGRHAMGGQQFGAGTVHLDTTALRRVLSFNRDSGLLEVEAGIHWDALVRWTLAHQREPARWGIAQKQTGANRIALGGSLAANAHGRGLTLRPLVADVERFTLVDAQGAIRTCSRTQDAELFRLVIGGYGLFGVVCAVTLRLAQRVRLERVVEVRDADGLADSSPPIPRATTTSSRDGSRRARPAPR